MMVYLPQCAIGLLHTSYSDLLSPFPVLPMRNGITIAFLKSTSDLYREKISMWLTRVCVLQCEYTGFSFGQSTGKIVNQNPISSICFLYNYCSDLALFFWSQHPIYTIQTFGYHNFYSCWNHSNTIISLVRHE